MVHAYSLEGFHILLDVNSGLVHIADELTIKLVQLINQDIEDGLFDDLEDDIMDGFDEDFDEDFEFEFLNVDQ